MLHRCPKVFYPSGSTAITGWTAFGPGETQLTHDSFLPSSDGHQWVDLTGNYGYNKGLMSDAVQTTAGRSYTLSFDLGNYVPFGSSTIVVGVTDQANRQFTNIVNASSTLIDWEHFTMSFVATSSATRISFMGIANGNLSNDAGIGLDNVSLVQAAVPEPQSWALMLAGAGLLGLVARRRGSAPRA